MKILIVDDNPVMRKTIRIILAELTDTVLECVDGSEVVSVYSEELPNYVFMDMDMPIMNGLEATQELLKAFPDAKVIFITNHNEHHLREAAIKAGAVGYYLKDNLINLKNYFRQMSVSYS